MTEIRVDDGRKVAAGDVLASDPENFRIPLLAPRAGTVRLEALEGHVVIERLEPFDVEHFDGSPAGGMPSHVEAARSDPTAKRRALVELGAWQFFSDAHSGAVLDPSSVPSGVIVSTIHLEPFVARGDVQLHGRLDEFARGLEHLQNFLEYQPIRLVVPDLATPFAKEIREAVAGYAFVQLVAVPLRYPFDHASVLARRLGLPHDLEHPVWAIPTAGIFAVDRALTFGRPVTERLVSLGGPAVDEPVHVRIPVGYPIDDVLANHVCREPARVVSGGVFSGDAMGEDRKGLDTETAGLTVLAENRSRHLFGFARPGWSRRSYGRTFLSGIRPTFAESMNTALQGELRPCIACGQCVDVCPAGIMPNVIHKYLYADEIENTIDARVDLCFECGLCSYVCPSKIDLRQQFIDAKRAIQEELEAVAEAEAALEVEA